MEERDVTLNGESFHLREWGDPANPRLLMLHGFPEYGGAWAELAGRLSDRFHCVAPDQRGYGQSWAPEEVAAYKATTLAGDMVALVEQLGGPVTVLGHDWGAAIAYALAIGRPDLVDRLIIINGVHAGPFQKALASGGPQATASQYFHFLRREGSENRLAANDYEKLLGLFGEAMDMSWLTPDLRAAYVAEWSRPGRLKGMVNWYRASPVQVPRPGESLDLPEVPTDKFRVTMPHLLIWGVDDRALLPDGTEGLEAYCDDLTRVEVPGADHWIVHQRPDEVAAILRDWLDR